MSLRVLAVIAALVLATPAAASADEIVERGTVVTVPDESRGDGSAHGDDGSASTPETPETSETSEESPILPTRQESLEQRLARALDVCIGAREYCRADRDWWVERAVALEEVCLHPETPDRTPDWGLILGGTGVGVAVGVIATVVVYEATK